MVWYIERHRERKTNRTNNDMKIFKCLLCFLIVCCYILQFLTSSDVNEGILSNTSAFYREIKEKFDWKAFVELYPDCMSINNPEGPVQNENDALNYFFAHHKHDLSSYPRRYPSKNGFSVAESRLSSFIRELDAGNVPSLERTIVVYHIGWVITENSFEVTSNNIKIFLSALIDDSLSSFSSVAKTFYWINIIGGADNILYKYFIDVVNFFTSNVALVEWNLSPSDMYTHFKTLEIFVENGFLSPSRYHGNNITSIIFLNNECRGPLAHQYQGKWITQFQKLLSYDKNALVGPILSCEGKPHIQTHIFAIRTSFISSILNQYRNDGKRKRLSYWRYVVKHYEIGLTNLAISQNLTVSSFLYYHRFQNQTSFNGKCIRREKHSGFASDSNPIRWCSLKKEEIMFMKWGGTPFRKSGLVCDTFRLDMEKYLPTVQKEFYDYYEKKAVAIGSSSHPLVIIKENKLLKIIDHSNKLQLPFSLDLIIPETLRGGIFFDLYKQYDHENYLPNNSLSFSEVTSESHDNVCLFLDFYGNHQYHVRSTKKQRKWQEKTLLETMKKQFLDFYSCLCLFVYFLISFLSCPLPDSLIVSPLSTFR
jgi:hypothetical protein